MLARLQTLRPLERQVDDRARLPMVSETTALSVLSTVRRGFDVDRFVHAADLQHGVRADDLVVRDLDAGGLERLEAGDA